MATRGPQKALTATNALLLAFAVAGALVALNIVGSRVFGRADLTQDKVYKLSKGSRDTVAKLPDRLTVKVFISSGLQPPLNTYGQYIRDMLDEYAAASGGKLRWEVIDPLAPGKDEEETRKLRDEYKTKYKIKPITLERLSEAKLEIGSDNYLGIAFVYGDKIESIPQVASTEGLEYRITGLIRKMTATRQKKIGFVTSEQELQPGQGLRYVGQAIQQDYETTTVTLDKPVPDDVDVLMIVGPHQPFAEKAKYYLDQAIMKGKPVGIFIDGMIVEAPRGMQMPGMEQPRIGRANDHNLQDVFEKWGLKLHDDLILDEQNARGIVPVEGQMFLANYPTFVGVDEKGFTKGFALTQTQHVLVLPFASSVELTGDLKDGKGAKATPIAQSTHDTSWRQSGFFLFNPQVKLARSNEKGPFVLGYAIEGKLKTAFPNGPPGSDPNTSSPEAATTAKEAPDGERVIVMGTSGLFNDEQLPLQYEPMYRENLLFFLNAADWLTHDESLIQMRSKGMAARPLTIPPDAMGKATLWRYLCEIGIPFLVVALGVALWLVRNARRRAFHL